MQSGSFDDDSEPLVLKTHAPLQIENVDMRIDVLKAYLQKSPDAKIKDLKKSLVGLSKYTEDEFKELVKSASPEKYNEFYSHPKEVRHHSMPKEIIYLPKVTMISDDTIAGGSPYKESELVFVQTHSDLAPRQIYQIYKIAFPQSQRNPQFISDCRHLIKKYPEKYSRNLSQPRTITQKHVIDTHNEPFTNSHILAQAIDALYKSGKSPKVFSQIKPVIELIKDPNEINFAIECLTS